jgi:hypothetical protein
MSLIMLEQKKFSQFYLLNSNPWIDKDENYYNSVEHPFTFFESFNEFENLINSSHDFKNALILFNNIKTHQNTSYNCFELELSLLKENRIKYLNQIVTKLLMYQKELRHEKRKENFHIKYLENFFLLLLNSIRDTLKSIFISYHLELNNTNKELLSRWFYLRKSITSFQIKKYPEDKRFENLFRKYLISNRFISHLTEFSTFKTLFEVRHLENKINWVDRKSSLYYFIKLLILHNVIKSPKNKHWEITSEFFLLKGESLLPRDFLNQKETQNKQSRDVLEKFVKALSE